MQVVCSERSFWIYTLFTSLQLWGRLSASTSSPTLPPPTLDIYLRLKESVVLTCHVPEGYAGVFFMLYRFKEKVDSQELQSDAEQVLFTVRVKEGDSVEQELYCCLYKNQQNLYSAFSPYLQIEHLKASAPTSSIPSFPPPVLSVEPSAGVVKHGGMLSFSCSVPALPPQSLSQSNSSEYNPVSFLLLRAAEGTGSTSIIYQPQTSQVSNLKPQQAVFSVGPVRGGEDGKYSCLYQITRNIGLVNSTVSNKVQVTITEVLPVPTLVLQQHTEVWHLLCLGSPAYPGAVFTLYLADNNLPVATHHAKVIQHEAVFPVPVQDTSVALYQCQYSVLLGTKWSNSERSFPLAVTKGDPPQSSTGVDWSLVLGSFSAAVLLLSSVALLVVVTCRKVNLKGKADKKTKREETPLWNMRSEFSGFAYTSTTSQEWASEDTATKTAHPLSTFTNQNIQH